MTDWLRLLTMIFYAPLRGMREVRDRAALAPAAFLALLVNAVLMGYIAAIYLRNTLHLGLPSISLSGLFEAAGTLMFVAAVFAPLAIVFANVIEHRAGYRLFFQQEYASVTPICLYAVTAASLTTLVITVVLHLSGIDSSIGQRALVFVHQQIEIQPQLAPLFEPRLLNVGSFAAGLMFLVYLGAFGIWAIIAVSISLRLSAVRAVVVVCLSATVSLPVLRVALPVFSTLLASPFLLLLLFFLLRGYFSQIVGQQRARAAFKQNLEVATINPRDSSAHYNLGLIHQQRGELDQARERFQRAIEIDPDEIDAHYQLGRIARAQNRLAEAIGHFEQVVQRDQSHAQQEIWREIGSTYVAANQFSDARDVLERFLERRPNDPEGLYLMGRAHAGLGHQREAASSMQACIEAVKTAPAYKYRTDKRWLNEAQQFLKGNRQEAVSRQ